MAAVRPSSWIEFALADGTVVRLPQENLAAVIAVLRVLRGEHVDLTDAEKGIREGGVERPGPGIAGDLVLPAVVRRRGTRQDARRRRAPPVAPARGGADLEPHASLAGQRRGTTVLPRSAIGEALGCLRNQWSALAAYLGDGRIPIDNDQSEQTIRPLTVGRANWLFLGHPRAAAGRLQMVGVVSSAHRRHLVIGDYLEDVLRRLTDAQQNHPSGLEPDSPHLLDLLPDRWALTHPQSVRRDRIDDKEMVWEAKRLRRVRGRIEARAIQAPAARQPVPPVSLARPLFVPAARTPVHTSCLTRCLRSYRVSLANRLCRL